MEGITRGHNKGLGRVATCQLVVQEGGGGGGAEEGAGSCDVGQESRLTKVSYTEECTQRTHRLTNKTTF